MRTTLLAADGSVLADSQRDPRLHALDNHANRPEVQMARRTCWRCQTAAKQHRASGDDVRGSADG